MTVLYTDTFTGSDGAALPAAWVLGRAPAGGAAAIQGNAMRLTCGSAGGYNGQARVSRRYMTNYADLDVRCRVNKNGGETYPLLGMRADNNLETANGYYLQLDSSKVDLTATVNYSGGPSLGSINLAIADGSWRWVRLRVVGSSLRVKTWSDGAAEPAAWGIDITDTTIAGVGAFGFTVGSGNVGGNYVTVDDVEIAGAGGFTPPAPTKPVMVRLSGVLGPARDRYRIGGTLEP